MKTTEKNAQGHFWSVHPSFERELRTTLFATKSSSSSGSSGGDHSNQHRHTKTTRPHKTHHHRIGGGPQQQQQQQQAGDLIGTSPLLMRSRVSAGAPVSTIMRTTVLGGGSKGQGQHQQTSRNGLSFLLKPTMTTTTKRQQQNEAAAAATEEIIFSPVTYPCTNAHSAEMLNSSIGPSSNLSKCRLI